MMMQSVLPYLGITLILMSLAACAQTGVPLVPAKAYLGSKVRLLDPQTMMIDVKMQEGTTNAQLRRYALCAASGYAMVREQAYLQNVRTLVRPNGNPATANVVYVMSADRPAGQGGMDVRVLTQKCATYNIPRI